MSVNAKQLSELLDRNGEGMCGRMLALRYAFGLWASRENEAHVQSDLDVASPRDRAGRSREEEEQESVKLIELEPKVHRRVILHSWPWI